VSGGGDGLDDAGGDGASVHTPTRQCDGKVAIISKLCIMLNSALPSSVEMELHNDRELYCAREGATRKNVT
jgi:hypothetical protein